MMHARFDDRRVRVREAKPLTRGHGPPEGADVWTAQKVDEAFEAAGFVGPAAGVDPAEKDYVTQAEIKAGPPKKRWAQDGRQAKTRRRVAA